MVCQARRLCRNCGIIARGHEALAMIEELQEKVLQQACTEKTPVTIFLKSGVKLTGNILGFDKFALLISGETVASLVYKHAIATLTPPFAVNSGRPA